MSALKVRRGVGGPVSHEVETWLPGLASGTQPKLGQNELSLFGDHWRPHPRPFITHSFLPYGVNEVFIYLSPPPTQGLHFTWFCTTILGMVPDAKQPFMGGEKDPRLVFPPQVYIPLIYSPHSGQEVRSSLKSLDIGCMTLDKSHDSSRS